MNQSPKKLLPKSVTLPPLAKNLPRHAVKPRRTAAAMNEPVLSSKSVGAVVLNSHNHTLLVFQRKNRYWEFPKGKVEGTERELETLRREIFEETGIQQFEILKPFRKVVHYDFRYKGRLIRRIVVYYVIRTHDRVRISREHTQYRWLPFVKAKTKLKHANQMQMLDDVAHLMYG